MADNWINDPDETTVEAPGRTQATHAADVRAGTPETAPDVAVTSVELVTGATTADGTVHETDGGARGRIAERVSSVSSSLERRAHELELKGGLKARAAPAVRKASHAADTGAAYVRDNNLEDMRRDVEDGIREHPLRSMAIAVGAGYLLAKLLD